MTTYCKELSTGNYLMELYDIGSKEKNVISLLVEWNWKLLTPENLMHYYFFALVNDLCPACYLYHVPIGLLEVPSTYWWMGFCM